MKDIVNKINEGLQLNEARKSDTAVKPFESKEELMAFVDEVEKTKLIVKKYEDEAQKVYNEMQKAQNAASKAFDKLKIKMDNPEWDKKYDEIYKDKYDIDGYIKKADAIMNTEECKKAQDKLYGELQQRALDSLSPKEQKAIGKRGGRMYNILAEVFKKYMHYDFKKNKPVE
jgi:hypothetical protein